MRPVLGVPVGEQGFGGGISWAKLLRKLGLAFGYDLGRSSACRLACLLVLPFRQLRRTRVSSPINTARVTLSLNGSTYRYIHHALRLIIDWVGPAALGWGPSTLGVFWGQDDAIAGPR